MYQHYTFQSLKCTILLLHFKIWNVHYYWYVVAQIKWLPNCDTNRVPHLHTVLVRKQKLSCFTKKTNCQNMTGSACFESTSTENGIRPPPAHPRPEVHASRWTKHCCKCVFVCRRHPADPDSRHPTVNDTAESKEMPPPSPDLAQWGSPVVFVSPSSAMEVQVPFISA